MSSESLAYYRSGLALLKHVEARQPTNRRFGAEADALWSQVKGELTELDRIEILLRDADAQWPGAFGASNVFHLRGVAEDEPFGAEWRSISGVEAADLWRSREQLDAQGVEQILCTIAASWGISLARIELEPITPTTQLVVAGPSAIAALIRAFAGIAHLDWAEQVTVVATSPAERQLAAAAGAILGSTKRSIIVTNEPSDVHAVAARLKGQKLVVVCSPDAAPQDAAAAKRLAGEA
jgi:hypothetical protein